MYHLENWTEVTKGIYRYVIAVGACYEIHILYHDNDTDIMNAKSNLYLVGNWCLTGKDFFERELLLSEKTVKECIQVAIKDDVKNNQ